jgi:predicted dithiol-disulfide oxidoreductase (DUF899 family)
MTVMSTFAGKSVEDGAARDRQPVPEIEQRRAKEAAAGGRRERPPAQVLPEDYVFEGRPLRPDLPEGCAGG